MRWTVAECGRRRMADECITGAMRSSILLVRCHMVCALCGSFRDASAMTAGKCIGFRESSLGWESHEFFEQATGTDDMNRSLLKYGADDLRLWMERSKYERRQHLDRLHFRGI